jgi:hypothetical protein
MILLNLSLLPYKIIVLLNSVSKSVSDGIEKWAKNGKFEEGLEAFFRFCGFSSS